MTSSPGTSAPPRRVAAIDIGTNSVLLLVAERDGEGRLVPVVERATVTRLGEGVDRTRKISPSAAERTLACLERYAGEILSLGAAAIDAVGTSAIRDAHGGNDFRRAAARVLAVEPRVIDGEEEARLTFRGGLSGLDWELRRGKVGVFDIGGGSTEFIAGDGGQVQETVSVDVGSVRLTERHVRQDPPSRDDVSAIIEDIRDSLTGVPDLSGRPLVGVAGTVTTLAAIARAIDPYDGARVHGAAVTRDELHRVVEQLLSLRLDDRKHVRGLDASRADVIVAGALLCCEIVDRFHAPQVIVSDRGVRWGLAEELAERVLGPPVT